MSGPPVILFIFPLSRADVESAGADQDTKQHPPTPPLPRVTAMAHPGPNSEAGLNGGPGVNVCSTRHCYVPIDRPQLPPCD